MDRLFTGNIAEMYFVPTANNKENLIEGIYITGNTVIDAIKHTVKPDYVFNNHQLKNVDFSSWRYILMTAHRRDNLGEPLENICRAVKRLVEDFEDLNIIYPVYLNPAVREIVDSILGDIGDINRIYLIDPIDVEDMHNLMDKSYMIMTDSGGLQEEAPHFGKPVLVLHTETERPEALSAGTVKLVGGNEDDICNIDSELLVKTDTYKAMVKAVNPYGDGNAPRRIVQAILHKFGLGDRPEEFRKI